MGETRVMMLPVSYPPNKKKILGHLVLSSLIVIFGVVLVLNYQGRHGTLPREFRQMAAASLVVYVGLTTVRRKTQLLFSDNGLVLDSDGIHDRTNHLGFVPWNNIEGSSVRRFARLDMIELHLRNSDEWLRSINPLRRWIVWFAIKAGYRPAIAVAFLQATPADVRTAIERLIPYGSGSAT